MGKRLRTQRRGKGSPTHRSPSHRAKAEVSFRPLDKTEREGYIKGQVIRFIDDPFHQALLMEVRFEDNSSSYLIAPEGIKVSDTVYAGANAPISLGSIIPLKNVPEGVFFYNVEKIPGDGGKLVRVPGSYATILTKEESGVLVKLPSRKTLKLSPDCRVQLGIVNGAGITELPLLKAGKAYHKRHAMNRDYPHVRGVAKNPVAHPFGGKEHHPGKSMSTAKGAPPGRKVGHIAARRTGRKK